MKRKHIIVAALLSAGIAVYPARAEKIMDSINLVPEIVPEGQVAAQVLKISTHPTNGDLVVLEVVKGGATLARIFVRGRALDLALRGAVNGYWPD